MASRKGEKEYINSGSATSPQRGEVNSWALLMVAGGLRKNSYSASVSSKEKKGTRLNRSRTEKTTSSTFGGGKIALVQTGY